MTSIMERSCQPRPNGWSDECFLGFIGQSIYEVSHFSSLSHCLRPSKWRAGRSTGRNSRPYAKLRYLSEPPLVSYPKLCTYLILTQPPRELQSNFTSILPLPKLKKLTAPNFWLNKDGVTDESPPVNAPAPGCFSPFTKCQNRNMDRKFRPSLILLCNDVERK